MIDTLQTMEKICGDSPAYIEVTEDSVLIVRGINHKTGQRVLSVIAGVIGEWLPPADFERSFKIGEEKEIKQKKKKVKRLADVKTSEGRKLKKRKIVKRRADV